jgi:hypothetical protein
VSTLGDLLEQLDREDLERLAERLRPFLRADGDGWLDAKAAAAHAGCTVEALRHARRVGALEFEQHERGGKVWFRRAALDRWRARG